MSVKIFDTIIVGGSYAGLAAGMTLGRALKQVLIMDDGKPCNRQTPHSHNFLTNDGKEPAQIAATAKEQVRAYPTVQFFDGTAVQATLTGNGFQVATTSGKIFNGKTLVFATGIKDLLPAIDGVADSWGISVLHCPYCHGYEVRGKVTGVLGNSDHTFDFVRLISNWTNDLTLFTNGSSALTNIQREKLSDASIDVVEQEIAKLEHADGYVQRILFKDGSSRAIDVIYAPSPFEQQCKVPEALGCELTAEGYIKTDEFHETNVQGVYAIGDNASKTRTLANAVAAGTSAGIAISKKMILAAK